MVYERTLFASPSVSAGVEYIKGYGRMTSASDVTVELIEGGTQAISAKRVILATGSSVTPFPGGAIEIDEETVRHGM